MKQLQFISLLACGALLAGCESTGSAGMGNQERKRLAVVEQQQQVQVDESDSNLWHSQQDKINRDSNPAALPR